MKNGIAVFVINFLKTSIFIIFIFFTTHLENEKMKKKKRNNIHINWNVIYTPKKKRCTKKKKLKKRDSERNMR